MSTNSKKTSEKSPKKPQVLHSHAHFYLTSFTKHPHNHPHTHFSQPLHRLLTSIHTALPQNWTTITPPQTSYRQSIQTLCPFRRTTHTPPFTIIKCGHPSKTSSKKSGQNRGPKHKSHRQSHTLPTESERHSHTSPTPYLTTISLLNTTPPK